MTILRSDRSGTDLSGAAALSPVTGIENRELSNGRVPEQPEPAVAIEHLNFSFEQGDLSNQVLTDINLVLPQGQIVILTGPSGSGKTTLLTLIGALRTAHEGSLRVLGHQLIGLRGPELVEIRRNIGFIFQAHNLFESLTAAQNVQMAVELTKNLRQKRQIAVDILERLGLGDRVDYKPKALSGGQKQRVAIARALVNKPRLILADEPTAALDKDSGREVVTIVKELAQQQGSTVLMVTHDNRILDVADRIVNLVDGSLESDQQMQEFIHEHEPESLEERMFLL